MAIEVIQRAFLKKENIEFIEWVVDLLQSIPTSQRRNVLCDLIAAYVAIGKIKNTDVEELITTYDLLQCH